MPSAPTVTFPGAKRPDVTRFLDAHGVELAVYEWGDPAAPPLFCAPRWPRLRGHLRPVGTAARRRRLARRVVRSAGPRRQPARRPVLVGIGRPRRLRRDRLRHRQAGAAARSLQGRQPRHAAGRGAAPPGEPCHQPRRPAVEAAGAGRHRPRPVAAAHDRAPGVARPPAPGVHRAAPGRARWRSWPSDEAA